MPWEVYITKSVFGKKIRKRFSNKAQAQTYIIILEGELENNRRVPLYPDKLRCQGLKNTGEERENYFGLDTS